MDTLETIIVTISRFETNSLVAISPYIIWKSKRLIWNNKSKKLDHTVS